MMNSPISPLRPVFAADIQQTDADLARPNNEQLEACLLQLNAFLAFFGATDERFFCIEQKGRIQVTVREPLSPNNKRFILNPVEALDALVLCCPDKDLFNQLLPPLADGGKVEPTKTLQRKLSCVSLDLPKMSWQAAALAEQESPYLRELARRLLQMCEELRAHVTLQTVEDVKLAGPIDLERFLANSLIDGEEEGISFAQSEAIYRMIWELGERDNRRIAAGQPLGNRLVQMLWMQGNFAAFDRMIKPQLQKIADNEQVRREVFSCFCSICREDPSQLEPLIEYLQNNKLLDADQLVQFRLVRCTELVRDFRAEYAGLIAGEAAPLVDCFTKNRETFDTIVPKPEPFITRMAIFLADAHYYREALGLLLAADAAKVISLVHENPFALSRTLLSEKFRAPDEVILQRELYERLQRKQLSKVQAESIAGIGGPAMDAHFCLAKALQAAESRDFVLAVTCLHSLQPTSEPIIMEFKNVQDRVLEGLLACGWNEECSRAAWLIFQHYRNGRPFAVDEAQYLKLLQHASSQEEVTSGALIHGIYGVMAKGVEWVSSEEAEACGRAMLKAGKSKETTAFIGRRRFVLDALLRHQHAALALDLLQQPMAYKDEGDHARINTAFDLLEKHSAREVVTARAREFHEATRLNHFSLEESAAWRYRMMLLCVECGDLENAKYWRRQLVNAATLNVPAASLLPCMEKPSMQSCVWFGFFSECLAIFADSFKRCQGAEECARKFLTELRDEKEFRGVRFSLLSLYAIDDVVGWEEFLSAAPQQDAVATFLKYASRWTDPQWKTCWTRVLHLAAKKYKLHEMLQLLGAGSPAMRACANCDDKDLREAAAALATRCFELVAAEKTSVKQLYRQQCMNILAHVQEYANDEVQKNVWRGVVEALPVQDSLAARCQILREEIDHCDSAWHERFKALSLTTPRAQEEKEEYVTHVVPLVAQVYVNKSKIGKDTVMLAKHLASLKEGACDRVALQLLEVIFTNKPQGKKKQHEARSKLLDEIKGVFSDMIARSPKKELKEIKNTVSKGQVRAGLLPFRYDVLAQEICSRSYKLEYPEIELLEKAVEISEKCALIEKYISRGCKPLMEAFKSLVMMKVTCEQDKAEYDAHVLPLIEFALEKGFDIEIDVWELADHLGRQERSPCHTVLRKYLVASARRDILNPSTTWAKRLDWCVKLQKRVVAMFASPIAEMEEIFAFLRDPAIADVLPQENRNMLMRTAALFWVERLISAYVGRPSDYPLEQRLADQATIYKLIESQNLGESHKYVERMEKAFPAFGGDAYGRLLTRLKSTLFLIGCGDEDEDGTISQRISADLTSATFYSSKSRVPSLELHRSFVAVFSGIIERKLFSDELARYLETWMWITLASGYPEWEQECRALFERADEGRYFSREQEIRLAMGLYLKSDRISVGKTNTEQLNKALLRLDTKAGLKGKKMELRYREVEAAVQAIVPIASPKGPFTFTRSKKSQS